VYTEGLYQELEGTPIQVHCLCPGHVNTNLYNSSKSLQEGQTGQQFNADAHETAVGGINPQNLSEGLSPEFVVNSLYDAIKKNQFYAIPMSPKKLPFEFVVASMHLNASDVEKFQAPRRFDQRTKEERKILKDSLARGQKSAKL
jgi:short-subunit dehydrogenase